jgi:hypothetical protein
MCAYSSSESPWLSAAGRAGGDLGGPSRATAAAAAGGLLRRHAGRRCALHPAAAAAGHGGGCGDEACESEEGRGGDAMDAGEGGAEGGAWAALLAVCGTAMRGSEGT